MSIGEGLPYVAAWGAIAAMFIAYMKLRKPPHLHKWKETKREELNRIMKGEWIKCGYISYCTCEECGEPRAFTLE